MSCRSGRPAAIGVSAVEYECSPTKSRSSTDHESAFVHICGKIYRSIFKSAVAKYGDHYASGIITGDSIKPLFYYWCNFSTIYRAAAIITSSEFSAMSFTELNVRSLKMTSVFSFSDIPALIPRRILAEFLSGRMKKNICS